MGMTYSERALFNLIQAEKKMVTGNELTASLIISKAQVYALLGLIEVLKETAPPPPTTT